MLPEANKIALCNITTHQLSSIGNETNTIWYEFYAASQIQMIIKTESASFMEPVNSSHGQLVTL